MLKEQHPTKNLQDFIKAIIDTKSKEEEDRIIARNLELLKSEINNINVSDAKQIEYAVKAVYSDMLGQDVSFAHIFVIKLIQSKNIEVKKIGYLASTLILEHDSEFKILLAASITNDLSKKDEFIVISALNAVCKLMLKDSAPAFLDQMIKLLNHKNPKIVQKALMGLQRIEQLSPNSIPRYAEEIRKGLQSKYPEVVQSAINIIYVELEKNKIMFLSLLPQLIQIQNQIIQKNMGYYYYQKIPEPFIQIQILKIITKLCQDNKKSSELVYDVLKKTLNRADNLTTDISLAVVYQCVLTISKIFPKKQLLEEASESISKFLNPTCKSNQIYLGINALKYLTEIDSSYIQKHQVFVVSCLESEDDTIRRITLELLYKNTSSKNLEIITSKFIESLKTTTDVLFKQDLTKKIFSLCIRYTKSNEWLMQKIDLLLEYSNNDFTSEMLNELINIYYENIQEDENFAEKLVHNYMEFFQKESLSNIMIKLVAWIIGNAGIPQYKSKPEFMQSLKEGLKILMYMKNSDDICKIWILDSFEKLIHQDMSYKKDIFEFLENFQHNYNEEIRLKIFQMKLMIDEKVDDEFDVQDTDLDFNFLTNFIQQKKGKYFDPEEAKNFEIISSDQKELNSLRFTHDIQNKDQEHKLGQESDQLIVDQNNKNKWTESGYIKEKKKEVKKEEKKIAENNFKIFDDKDIKKPKIKEQKQQVDKEEEQLKKKKENIANQLFQQEEDPMDIFNTNKKNKKSKKKKKELDFFNEEEQQNYVPYEISIEQYQELWEQIDNQIEKQLKIKTLKNLDDVQNFIRNLGFYIVEQNDQDFISSAKCNNDIILMYVQFVKKKCIEIILNSKNEQTMKNLLKKYQIIFQFIKCVNQLIESRNQQWYITF